MSTKDEKKVEALCREILKSVVQNIHSEYLALPVHLKSISEDKITNFETEMSRLIEDNDAERSRENRTALSQLRLMGRQQITSVIDKVIKKLLEKGYADAIEKYAKNPGGDFIKTLTIEGIDALKGKHFIIEITNESRAALGKDFLNSIVSHFKREGRGIDLTFSKIPGKDPGVRICTEDDRVSYDNTISDRFRRSRSRLFASVRESLKQEAEKEGFKG
jgi:vacuolar-type H+-ATPase subunit E/Vma4